MGLSKAQLKRSIDALAKQESAFRAALKKVSYPEPRIRDKGYATLLRTILGQQVSVASANAVWTKLEACLGSGCDPEVLLAQSPEELRAVGMSRQKQGYARSLAECITEGSLRLDRLPKDDEEAIEKLIQVKGIGRWSAEVYLLFAEGRKDVWPAGDLAIQVGVQRILELPERPSEKETRVLAESWSPHRGAAAIFVWHCYNSAAM